MDSEDLFVSCVDGLPVTRYGSRITIGADRVGNEFRYRPDEVVRIPADEHARYLREYTRALRDKSLVLRTAAEWEAQSARDSKAEADAAAAKAERKAKRDAESPPQE